MSPAVAVSAGAGRSGYEAAVRHVGAEPVDGLDRPDVVAAVACAAGPRALVEAAVERGLRLLLGTDLLGDLRQPPADWLPALPLRLSADVRAASDLLADGRVGPIRLARVVTYHGPPPRGAWQPDSPCAESRGEALVWGLDLAERLCAARAAQPLAARPCRRRPDDGRAHP